jgi:hypothetical protein
MKFTASILALFLSFATMAFAQVGPAQSDFKEQLSSSTLAVYYGKQVCKNADVETMFGPSQEWGCQLIRQFTCSATVVGQNGERGYIGLTAGHCFNWGDKDDYYVGDDVGEKSVLHKIQLIKFENDERYDFAVFSFRSGSQYPIISVDAESQGPVVGTDVLNVNYSFGLVQQILRGKVVSKMITDPAIGALKNTRGRYLVSIGLGPGASGSAIVDENTHKIVGIVEAVFPGTQMPTIIMPTGRALVNFMEDDSAGIRP